MKREIKYHSFFKILFRRGLTSLEKKDKDPKKGVVKIGGCSLMERTSMMKTMNIKMHK
jgi:hypothetical protein